MTTTQHEARAPFLATDGKTARGRCSCGWEGSNMTRAQAAKRTERHIREARALAAEDLGRKAHAAGFPAVPFMDPALADMLGGLMVGEGKPVMKAWSKGWTAAAVAAPIAEEV